MVTCDKCGKEIVAPNTFTTGYGVTESGEKHCYACCAVEDTEYMQTHDKTYLYLTCKDHKWSVQNWPGSLVIPVATPRKGKHNIANVRYDVWFQYAGKYWHGVQYGDWTQIVHCKAVKAWS